MERVANLGERYVQVLVSKPEGQRLLERPKRRWEDNTKMVVQGLVWVLGLNLSASV